MTELTTSDFTGSSYILQDIFTGAQGGIRGFGPTTAVNNYLLVLREEAILAARTALLRRKAFWDSTLS